MKSTILWVVLAFISILTSRFTLQAQDELLIHNVNVVDVAQGICITHRDLLIRGNTIASIAPTSKKTKPNSIDGTGKYLIPGLWDMHTHNWWQLHFSPLYVANGVLGVRNMYTPMAFIKPLKDSIEQGLIVGPKYYAAGRVLEGAQPEFPDWLVVDSVQKINAALDTLMMEGSDFVKVYNKIPSDVYFTLMDEARKRGLSVQGHLPMAVGAIAASNAGQKSFEHLLGMPDLCTRDTLFRNKYKYNWFAAVMREDDYATLRIDEDYALKNFEILKQNNTYVCPTLVVWYSYLHPDSLFENNPHLPKLTDEISGYWKEEIGKLRKKDQAYKNTALKKYDNLKQVTYLLYKAGVPMLAGTDVMNPYCLPGYSLHDELKLLKDCGIPDAEVLKMATLNAAQFMNLKNYGEVKPGYQASLVLLQGNPLTDIKQCSNIYGVVLNGIYYDKEALHKLLK